MSRWLCVSCDRPSGPRGTWCRRYRRRYAGQPCQGCKVGQWRPRLRDLLETMAVVGRDDDQSIVEDAQFLQFRNRRLDSVVELEEIAECPVVIQSMHLLVDGCGLAHKEEAFVAASLVENLDGLHRHVL